MRRVASNSPRRRKLARSTRPDGFTLVELLVALMVGGVAILGARAVFASLADHADRVLEVAAISDREANGERTLRALVGDLDMGSTTATTFGGDAHEARFTSWCSTPSGWKERCVIRLAVLPRDASDGSSVVVVFPDGQMLPLLAANAGMGLRYLRDATNGGTWFERWGTGITAPLAIGIVTDRDTLILRIGERG